MMMKLCSMAFLGNPSGIVLHQEHGMGRVIKDSVPLLPTSGVGHDITRSSSLNLRPHQLEEPWKPISGLFEPNEFVNIDSTDRNPVLIDGQVKDAAPSSLLFSYGIAENCARRNKILQYLKSGASEVEQEGFDLSLLSELMGLQMIPSDWVMLQSVPLLNYQISELNAQKPLLDFMGDMYLGSKVLVQPDGRVLFTGTGSEMKDLLALITEFYSSKDLTVCRKQSLLVPYFRRRKRSKAQAVADVSSLKLETLTVAPLKSPEKIKLNPSQKNKKDSRKQGKERDLYKKNSFHACESLLSFMVDRKRNGKTAIHSLKKSGPELPELLTKFSAGIAGTGIAVLFSIICRIAFARVPLCTPELLNTGFGIGLVWLAASVNRLRDTIVHISKNSNKLGIKEEEMMEKVDTSVKEIYFRAATLLAFSVLKLA